MREDHKFEGVLEMARNLGAVRRSHWEAMRLILERAVEEHGQARRAKPLAIESPGERDW